MPLTYQVTTAPTASIVTLSDVKQQLYIDTNDDDNLLQRLIDTAERYIGTWTQRALPTQTYTYYMDCFDGEIRLPISPVQSITSITYKDTDSADQVISSFQLDNVSQPTRILPALNAYFPETDESLNNVRIVFVAGYTDLADMRTKKQELEHAVMLLVGQWYENREAAQDISLNEIPNGFKNLLGLSDVGTKYA
jgi:uncharacterized phiE125 gp8 family phage protein